jgi:hypothetical protein
MGSAPRALLPTPSRDGGGGRRNASCQASFSRRLTFTAVGSLALGFDLAMANLRGPAGQSAEAQLRHSRLIIVTVNALPNCGGFLIREPASVRCVACGCRWEIFDADGAARLKQRLLDWIWRPRSVERLPEYQDLVEPPTHPGRGWVTLPGPGRQSDRAARQRGPTQRNRQMIGR